MIADEGVVDRNPKFSTHPKYDRSYVYTLYCCYLLILQFVYNSVHYTCGGGHGRKKDHKDDDDDNKTIAVTEFEGLKTRLKNNKAF